MVAVPRADRLGVRRLRVRRPAWLVVPRPARAVLGNLVSIPLTVAGLVCIDLGVFTISAAAGWLVTGVSLIGLEYLIADEDQ